MTAREVAGSFLRLVRHIEWVDALVGSATICLVARWAPWPVASCVAGAVGWFIVRAAIDRMLMNTQQLLIDEMMKVGPRMALSHLDGEN